MEPTVPTPAKPVWWSKLNWLGIATAVIGALTFFQGQEYIQAYPELVSGIAVVIGFLTVLLRTFGTTTQLTFSEKKADDINRFVGGGKLNAAFLAFTLLVPSIAGAQVVLDTAGAADGTYYLKVTIASGKASISPFAQDQIFSLKDLKPGGPTNPTDPPNQPSPLVLEVERITKTALNRGGTVTTGAGLSSAYSLVAEQVAAGNVQPSGAPTLLTLATDKIFGAVEDDVFWGDWRDAVSGALNDLSAQGQLGTKELMAKTLREISWGLDRATGFNTPTKQVLKITPEAIRQHNNRALGILDGIDIAKLIELIKLVMELFKLFGGGGAVSQ
jgi:hypothetical protein